MVSHLEDVEPDPADAGRWGGHGRRKPNATGRTSTDQATSDIWPDPLDFLADPTLTGTPGLQSGHLPEAITPFVFDTAERMGVDPAAVALGALVSLASVMSDEWSLQPKQHDTEWTERPRLWGAIVGDPSILKTPVLKATTKPIDCMEIEARKRYDEEMKTYKAKLKRWKDDGSDPETEPTMPRLDRYLVESTTVEALSEVLRDDSDAKMNAPAYKVLIRQDELSEWAGNFDRYRAGNSRGRGDRGAYLRLYNGDRYTVDRIGRGSFPIPNWSACVLGGIQPGPIQQIAAEASEDGLLQRFCYCVPTRQIRGSDRKPNEKAGEQYSARFPALAAMHPGKLSGGASRSVVLHRNAHQHRLAILDLADSMAAMPDTSTRLKAALGKWPGLFARLTLVFHLIEIADARARGLLGPSLEVVPEATARRVAYYMRDILLPHLLRADAVMFLTEQTGHARWIAGFILAKGQKQIAVRDVVQAYGALRAPERRRELLDVMESLESVGWLRAMPQDAQSRATTRWEVNPRVHEVFVARAMAEREMREATKQRLAEARARARST